MKYSLKKKQQKKQIQTKIFTEQYRTTLYT